MWLEWQTLIASGMMLAASCTLMHEGLTAEAEGVALVPSGLEACLGFGVGCYSFSFFLKSLTHMMWVSVIFRVLVHVDVCW